MLSRCITKALHANTPQDAKHILRGAIVGLLLGLAWCVKCLEYLQSPHTEQTISLFAKCNFDLATVMINTVAHIRKTQPSSEPLHLHQCTLADIPNDLVEGMEFGQFRLCGGCQVDSKVPLSEMVVWKFFNALGTLRTSYLAITNLQICAGNMPSAPGRVTKVKASKLGLYNVDIGYLHWIIRQMDLSESSLTIYLSWLTTVVSLEFLDAINCKEIYSLYMKHLPALGSIDCNVLRNGRVKNRLIFKNVSRLVAASPETLCGIGKKRWLVMGCNKALWERIAPFCKKGEEIAQLDLVFIYNKDVKPACRVNTNCPNTTVQNLGIRLAYPNNFLGKQDGLNMLAWIANSFTALVHIDVRVRGSDFLAFYLRNTFFDIKTLPFLLMLSIDSIACNLVGQLGHLPPMLGLSLSACSDWVVGEVKDSWDPSSIALAEQLTQVCPDFFSSISGRNTDPTCPICLYMPGSSEGSCVGQAPTHFCVLDAGRHMVCNLCFVHLVQGSIRAKANMTCPLCREPIPWPVRVWVVDKKNITIHTLPPETPRHT
ncbi:hypothetical protein NEDG_00198 [Nematocida displodere]|uniref:RING-type domain-containing protein n=1 Tax=Nematocida displodere TaxID=1805483 RepID=A0A177EID0_9MICR|nr:hypothetical protein NEDG_00198 [Nematocida displodere]